jgi:hypothetical protein
MAFPVPEHLPRAPKSKEHDISSSVINKVAETKTFDATTASGWVAELDGAVLATKVLSSSTYVALLLRPMGNAAQDIRPHPRRFIIIQSSA